ncbi:S8 family serine peptidase [Deinococcus peraridilitoris]|uniref:Subtilisin-like serine protease n=1 Tax=Deinococcus peraridilitoris (strain DSM 19664 / LMG 22246 / CIP 109416 / KR-200) TaxID=937777 RepID=K9ZYH3_DEIPD|nr:S8 family serine peptidase [Deinococcus peraridilitoris]AFZ65987.1 subtilisin-like serine protease [Deinococcus peraridilitoris DSM 19664]
MKHPFRWLAPALIAGLLACGQTNLNNGPLDEDSLPPAPNTRGNFSGTVGYVPDTLGVPAESPTSAENIVAGQLIVKFKSGVSAQSLSLLSVKGAPVERVRALAIDGAGVYRVPGADARATQAAARELAARPDVEYAEPDRIVRAWRTPNDPSYTTRQWNLQDGSGGIRLPTAWNTTIGANSTVVAIIDTGILYRRGDVAASHPDLPSERLLPGYDFITNANCNTGAACSGDGDGRDGDPYDVGDDPTSPSYHGTFVVGIVGAASDNRVGMAGVNWGTRLLPVRALGPGGGTSSDIIDALLYAAGVASAGVPNNPTPADVINLSLGGEGTCGTAFQAAINKALGGPKKPLIVVAAGNGGKDGVGDNASGTFPANCQGVMAVGATTRSGARASYSNYGSVLSVMAPGGAPGDGVWSLTRHSGQFTYAGGAGTSYAAPHVAGLAALMRAVTPALSALELQRLMENTAQPVSCNTPNGESCGAGLINAAAAVQAALSGAQIFALSPANNLQIEQGSSRSVTIKIERSAGFGGAVDLSVGTLPTGVRASFDPDPATGTSSTLTLTVDTSAKEGIYSVPITGVSGDQRATTALNLRVGPPLGIRGTHVRADYYQGKWVYDESKSGSLVIDTDGTTSPFAIPNRGPGWYFVYAVHDTNKDDQLNAGDYFGYSEYMLNPPEGGIKLQMELVTDIADLKLTGAQLRGVQRMLARPPVR